MPDDVIKRVNEMGSKGKGVDGVEFRKRHDDSIITNPPQPKPLESQTELVRIGDDDDDDGDDSDYSESSSQTSDSTDDVLIFIGEEMEDGGVDHEESSPMMSPNDDPISIRPPDEHDVDTPLGEDGILRDDTGNKVSIDVGDESNGRGENEGTGWRGGDGEPIGDTHILPTHEYGL